jgi:hypothetical protein
MTIKWELTRVRSEIVLSNMKNNSFLLKQVHWYCRQDRDHGRVRCVFKTLYRTTRSVLHAQVDA